MENSKDLMPPLPIPATAVTDAQSAPMDRVIITRPIVGICHMQVCADNGATDEEILEKCNRENISGTSNGWAHVCRSNDEAFLGASIPPIVCSDYPSTRTHFLVGC